MRSTLLFILLLSGIPLLFSQERIDRKALVQRHNVVVEQADSLSSLSVGNGRFAFTVDFTGLQSFPAAYQNGIPLGTQSEWGWHSFPNTAGYQRWEYLKTYHLNGKDRPYAVQSFANERNKSASDWFRQNPHRLQLGNLGFVFLKKNGTPAALKDLQNIRQALNLWTGEIRSRFTFENIPVEVSTFCHQQQGVISVSVRSTLIREGRLLVTLRFPYPTGAWSDPGTFYEKEDNHQSIIETDTGNTSIIRHTLDSSVYWVDFQYGSPAKIAEEGPHHFIIHPDRSKDVFEWSTRFRAEKAAIPLPSYVQTRKNNASFWQKYWQKGGAIDFSGSTDPRAFELERRIILSQYLIKIQETCASPSQETGLTYNSWYGVPHMEMIYWHLGHYLFWGRKEMLEKSLAWYFRAAGQGRVIAQRQGYEGIRWPKMTNNDGSEVPSSIGAFLLWQQPHLIYFAENLYRLGNKKAVLKKYKDLVFATADFMASYPFYEKEKDRYILGKGVIPAQERYDPEITFNPTYELVYWHWALRTAQDWRKRLHLPPNEKWAEVLQKLSALPVKNDKYLFTESAADSYENPRLRTDHPSVLMAYGVLPGAGQVDKKIMENTFHWIWDHWSWQETWGWDFPMVAMTATRLGLPDKAIDALFMDIPTNTYLPNGHNYQTDRLRIYLPGNGALLLAVAMMVAGCEDCNEINPGIPKDGTWKVRWENLFAPE